MDVATVMTDQSASPSLRLERLRALILLGGSVRPGRFGACIRRLVFQLPLRDRWTILDAWRSEAASLVDLTGGSRVPLRVMVDRAAPEPLDLPSPSAHLPSVQFDRDPFDYRGTGGVLRDLAA